jgi:hypothetical protein
MGFQYYEENIRKAQPATYKNEKEEVLCTNFWLSLYALSFGLAATDRMCHIR